MESLEFGGSFWELNTARPRVIDERKGRKMFSFSDLPAGAKAHGTAPCCGAACAPPARCVPGRLGCMCATAGRALPLLPAVPTRLHHR